MVSSFYRANEHVVRSMQLIEAQRARVHEFERRGWNVEPARTLLQVMLRSFRLMVEHRDRLIAEGAGLHAAKAYEGLLWPSDHGDAPDWPVAAHNGLPWPLAPAHLRRPVGSQPLPSWRCHPAATDARSEPRDATTALDPEQAADAPKYARHNGLLWPLARNNQRAK